MVAFIVSDISTQSMMYLNILVEFGTEGLSFAAGLLVGLLPTILEFWHGEHRKRKHELDANVYNELYKETVDISNGSIQFDDWRFITTYRQLEPKDKVNIPEELKQELENGYVGLIRKLNTLQKEKEELEKDNAPFNKKLYIFLRMLSPDLLRVNSLEEVNQVINEKESSLRRNEDPHDLVEYINKYPNTGDTIWDFLNRNEDDWNTFQEDEKKYWSRVRDQRNIFNQLQENSAKLQSVFEDRMKQSPLTHALRSPVPSLKYDGDK